MENEKITDVSFVLEMFNINTEKAVNSFIEYMNTSDDEVCFDIPDNCQTTDEEARIIIRKLRKVNSANKLQRVDASERNKYIKIIWVEYKLSIRQTERLAGISRGVVQRI